MSGLGVAAGMVRPRALRKAVAGRRTGRRLLVRVILVAAVGAGGIGVVDGQNVALQKPAECGQGQVAVAVPRPHMWPVTSLPGMSGPGPHLRDVVASQAPQVALLDVIRANPGLGVTDPMGDLPRAPGGRMCVQLPAVAKVTQSTLVLQGPAVAETTVTAAKVSPGPGKWRKLPYAALFEKEGRQHGVDPALLSSQVWRESGYHPRARSKAGAMGLCQFMPGTARKWGLRNPYDPAQAVDAQARLMAHLIKRYHSVPLALAAYNSGSGAVDRYHGVPPYTETRGYVKAITAKWKAIR